MPRRRWCTWRRHYFSSTRRITSGIWSRHACSTVRRRESAGARLVVAGCDAHVLTTKSNLLFRRTAVDRQEVCGRCTRRAACDGRRDRTSHCRSLRAIVSTCAFACLDRRFVLCVCVCVCCKFCRFRVAGFALNWLIGVGCRASREWRLPDSRFARSTVRKSRATPTLRRSRSSRRQ